VADKLDFGEALIGSTPKLFLHVRNESAISAHYSISADYFIAKPPTPPTDKASHRRLDNSRFCFILHVFAVVYIHVCRTLWEWKVYFITWFGKCVCYFPVIAQIWRWVPVLRSMTS